MQAARCSQSFSLSTALGGSLRGKVRGAAGVLHAQRPQVPLIGVAIGGGLICGGLLTLHSHYLHISAQICQQVADEVLSRLECHSGQQENYILSEPCPIFDCLLFGSCPMFSYFTDLQQPALL